MMCDITLPDDVLGCIMQHVASFADDPLFCKCTKLLCNSNEWTRKTQDIRRPIVFEIEPAARYLGEDASVSFSIIADAKVRAGDLSVSINGFNVPFDVWTYYDGEDNLDSSQTVDIPYNDFKESRLTVTVAANAGIKITQLSNIFIIRPEAFVFTMRSFGNVGVEKIPFLFSLQPGQNLGPLAHLDVSNIRCMKGLFQTSTHFNQPIGNWNVSNVVDMTSMFAWCTDFNQDLSRWNTQKVEKFNIMFENATSFSRFEDVDRWSFESTTDVTNMFLNVPIDLEKCPKLRKIAEILKQSLVGNAPTAQRVSFVAQ